ncbi:MAG: response regulator [Elusimicrobia bacterium]|nr:response regulator [Elusimicrobiota bacterium]
MRILVADDDPSILRFVTRALEALGHTVESVSDGTELIRLAGAVKPDLILSDINMPQCDGITACCWLRKALPETRLFLMTGNSDSAFAAGRAGFHLVLRKPFELERLRDMLSL